MRISKPIEFAYKNHLQNVYFANEQIEEQEMKKLLSQIEKVSMAMNNTLPILYLIDYTKSEYIVMTEGVKFVSNHYPQQFLEGGVPFLLEIYQEDDFKIYNQHIFNTNLEFLKNTPQIEHQQYIFSYNFRVKHTNGHLVPIYQRGAYITSKETGLPLFSLGTVIDISKFKNDNLIYHTIEKIEQNNGFIQKETLISNCFYPNHEDKILSKHECNILELMADGFSSKQISGKMRISQFTVDTHRKNMLQKTNTKNVAELVAFAIRSRII